ncbi:hypothetical protein SAMN04488239_109128 [Ruegeria marina]|uniref:Response regulatory domain-containing protein n=2 Tax=Ruegeria marina TaxID=639004 RepID=A0A1G6WNX9_9RHOB|nr:hypothetical protein SAMN04488239_109128 [Ruegeria marina]
MRHFAVGPDCSGSLLGWMKAWLKPPLHPGRKAAFANDQSSENDFASGKVPPSKDDFNPPARLLGMAMDLIGPGLLLGRSVLVVGTSWRATGHVAGWLEDLGADVVTSKNMDHALGMLERKHDDCSLLVVMMDGTRDDDEIFDFLALIRLKHEDVPVLLLSRALDGNDYRGSGGAICDVALKIPIGRIAFEMGVLQAFVLRNDPDPA